MQALPARHCSASPPPPIRNAHTSRCVEAEAANGLARLLSAANNAGAFHSAVATPLLTRAAGVQLSAGSGGSGGSFSSITTTIIIASTRPAPLPVSASALAPAPAPAPASAPAPAAQPATSTNTFSTATATTLLVEFRSVVGVKNAACESCGYFQVAAASSWNSMSATCRYIQRCMASERQPYPNLTPTSSSGHGPRTGHGSRVAGHGRRSRREATPRGVCSRLGLISGCGSPLLRSAW